MCRQSVFPLIFNRLQPEYTGKRLFSEQPFVLREMTETLICFRELQQVAALPVTVMTPAVGYIEIDVLLVQVLVALFGVVVHPRGAVFEVRVGTDVKFHFLFSRHEDVVYADIVIDTEPVGVQREVADVRFQKVSPEVCRGLSL